MSVWRNERSLEEREMGEDGGQDGQSESVPGRRRLRVWVQTGVVLLMLADFSVEREVDAD